MDVTPIIEPLNDAQREAVTAPDEPVLVIAGAGSGKTRTLVYRVANLVLQGVPPESILLLTFTRRAAQEMLQERHDSTRAVRLIVIRVQKEEELRQAVALAGVQIVDGLEEGGDVSIDRDIPSVHVRPSVRSTTPEVVDDRHLVGPVGVRGCVAVMLPVRRLQGAGKLDHVGTTRNADEFNAIRAAAQIVRSLVPADLEVRGDIDGHIAVDHDAGLADRRRVERRPSNARGRAAR